GGARSHRRPPRPRRRGAGRHAPGTDQADDASRNLTVKRFLVRRLLLTIPVLIGVATLVFSLIHLVPGDPVQSMLGESASPEDIAEMRGRLGLDRPLVTQYVSFLK